MSGDWQSQLKNIGDRACYIYQNKLLFDCEFLVYGHAEVKCHKLILAMGSPVFQAMFYGCNALLSSGPVEIPDIEPSVFHQIIEYIYGQEIKITSSKNAFDLYYGAKKYLLSFLERDCVDYLKNNLTLENVLSIYEFAKFHCENALEKLCLMEIQKNTREVLMKNNISDISEDTLLAILDLNLMNIETELELFKVVEKWLHENFKDEPNTEFKKTEPQALFKKLRLLTLSIDEFADGPAKSEFLSDSEKLALLLRITKAIQTPMENGLSEQRNKRKQANFKSLSILEITEISNSKCDGSEWLTSVFTTNKPIDLLGVEIRLQVHDENDLYIENLTVTVSHSSSNDHFAEGILCGQARYNTKAEILFNNVTTLEPNKEYAIHTFLCRPGMYPVGRNSNPSCTHDGVTITFVSHTSWERAHPYNTTVLSSIIYADCSEE